MQTTSSQRNIARATVYSVCTVHNGCVRACAACERGRPQYASTGDSGNQGLTGVLLPSVDTCSTGTSSSSSICRNTYTCTTLGTRIAHTLHTHCTHIAHTLYMQACRHGVPGGGGRVVQCDVQLRDDHAHIH